MTTLLQLDDCISDFGEDFYSEIHMVLKQHFVGAVTPPPPPPSPSPIYIGISKGLSKDLLKKDVPINGILMSVLSAMVNIPVSYVVQVLILVKS